MVRGWRRASCVVAIVGAMVSVGLSPAQARADCAPSLTWRGVAYAGATAPNERLVRPGQSLGRAFIPPCNDVVGAPPGKGYRVRVRRVAGVPPRLAVYANGALFLAPGFFPALPDHPLHRAFRERATTNATRGLRCRRLSGLRGVVQRSFLDVDLNPVGRRSRVEVRIDSLTGIAGFHKAGYPFLERGDAVSVSGWRCRERGEPAPFVVARAIRPAS